MDQLPGTVFDTTGAEAWGDSGAADVANDSPRLSVAFSADDGPLTFYKRGGKPKASDVWFSTESTSYDWLAIYPEGIEPSASNYASATISGGKLGGGRAGTKAGATHKTFTVEGYTAQFFFKSDGSSNYYGYYAVVAKGARYLYRIDGTIEEPVREGFAFGGWNTAADGSGRDVELIDASDGEQLFAKWVANDGDAEPGNDETRMAGDINVDVPGAQSAENDETRDADEAEGGISSAEGAAARDAGDGGAGSLGAPSAGAKSLDTSGKTEPQADTSGDARAIATSAAAGALAAARRRRAG